MKVNAPEKIHVQPNAHDRWFEGKIPSGLPNGLFVEYVRKDAFIKKAKLWLAEIHRVCDITDEHGYRIELRELQAIFEDYMKGE